MFENRNIQITLFILISIPFFFYGFMAICVCFLSIYIMFSQINLVIDKFSLVFLFSNEALLIERYINFIGVTTLSVFYPFLSLFLYINIIKKLRKLQSIILDLVMLLLMICIVDFLFLTINLTVKAYS